jgi:hypothetical protein
MAKASFTLQNGTIIEVEGTVEEIHKLIEFYGGSIDNPTKKVNEASPSQTVYTLKRDKLEDSDLAEVVNTIKTCEQAEVIEKYILDKTNEANRVLLPLFIVYEYFDNAFGLTTSEISKITIELGVKVSRQNVLRALKFSAKAYTIKSGNPPRYNLNRRGVAFMRAILSGAEAEETTGKNKKAKMSVTTRKSKIGKKAATNNKGPRTIIKELIEDGFFMQKKTLSEIQRKLEEMGHIYAQTSLSGPLLQLVRDKNLNRTKEDDVWLYSTR